MANTAARNPKSLFRERDYHGTTIACLSAGGQPERNAQYGPFTPGFVEIPHCLEYHVTSIGVTADLYGEACVKATEAVILREGPDTIGSICLEPITAGGGVIVPTKGLLGRHPRAVQKIRNPAAHRRSRLWRGPHRHLVWLPALRRPA